MTIRSLLLLGLCSFAAHDLSHAAKPLNVVFMLADDLGSGDVGCYGQKKFATPNIDRLAAEGVKFTQHYSGAPVCAPARCVLMTGKHLGNAEIRGNQQAKVTQPEFDEGQHPISAEIATLPQTLRQAGYATGAMGKWGLGPVGSSGDPNRKGFDLFFGYNCQAVAHSYYPAFLWRNAEKLTLNAAPISGHDQHQVTLVGKNYAPLAMVSEAETFLAAQKESTKPFFLYLAFIEPHVAMHPPEAEVEKFPKEWDTEPYLGENGYLPHKRPHAGYAAMVTMLDGYVGRVLNALEATGKAGETLVVFTSDNGATHPMKATSKFNCGGADASFFNSCAGLKGFKGSVYEGGLRVPCIVRCPGKIKPGTQTGLPSYFADWFPTLCAATGTPNPEKMDGENLWDRLTTAPSTERERPMVWVFPEYGGQVAVRLGPYKVLRRDLKKKLVQPWEVFDIQTDPTETKNLAKEKPELIAQAKAVLAKETAPNAIFPMKLPTD